VTRRDETRRDEARLDVTRWVARATHRAARVL
jgi:hypothetical protein